MNMKRMRGRNHRPNNAGGGGGFRNQQNGIPLNRNHVFDSSGPEMRVRGTAQQLHEKYTQMARDASSSGDRVLGEAYYQHAEHYFRIISAINQAQNQNGQPQPAQQIPQNQSHNGGSNGYSGQNDYARRNDNYAEAAPDNGFAEPRYADRNGREPQTQEFRGQEPRSQEPRSQEPRVQEPRGQDARRTEPRTYEPRQKTEFPRAERYRPDAPMVDARIDISSALEAELAAAAAPPMATEQPPPVLAARAIAIIPDAPPVISAVKTPRPRGRPRLAKLEAAKDAE